MKLSTPLFLIASLVIAGPSSAKAGGVWGDGSAMGEAAGRAFSAKLSRAATAPIFVGASATVSSNELAPGFHAGLGMALFDGDSEELVEAPWIFAGAECTLIPTTSNHGDFVLDLQYFLRIGIGPITLGGALGLGFGLDSASFLVSAETSLPLRMPLSSSIRPALEIFIRGDLHTNSDYPQPQALLGLRLWAW